MTEKQLLPYETCTVCSKPLQETEGRRLIPIRYPDEATKKRIKEISAEGFKPWICQLCANMTCQECGSPYQRPMSYDVLCHKGDSYHIAIFPVSPGCVNENCKHHYTTMD